MDQNQRLASKTNDLTHQELIRDGAVAAAGLAVAIVAVGGESASADTRGKIRSYNPEMEYRRLGKTGLWVSAVCLRGHWKRVDKMVPGVFKSQKLLSADLDSDGFKKNRRELDLVEAKELEKAMDEAWAKLPTDYQWLKDWEYV